MDVIRTVIEECWANPEGVDRMESLVAPAYVHHTPFGDTDFAGFRQGLGYVDSVFAERTYRVEHVVREGELVAAYLSWTATRRSDGTPVEGRGAYHCRLEHDRIAEDWDLFFPMS